MGILTYADGIKAATGLLERWAAQLRVDGYESTADELARAAAKLERTLLVCACDSVGYGWPHKPTCALADASPAEPTPDDLTVSHDEFAEIVRRVENPSPPTEALVAAMRRPRFAEPTTAKTVDDDDADAFEMPGPDCIGDDHQPGCRKHKETAQAVEPMCYCGPFSGTPHAVGCPAWSSKAKVGEQAACKGCRHRAHNWGCIACECVQPGPKGTP